MNTINDIAEHEWDVFVIGGGIFGAAVARDAVLRGFKTALVEQNDFASETSGRSTKLIHGGIRYLEHLNFGLVRESLNERTILLTIAPHLVRPLPFVIPVFKGDRFPLAAIRLGTWLYSKLAGKNVLKKHEHYGAHELKKRFPILEEANVTGAVRYYDAQMDDARLTLETILSAQTNGAACTNHTEVTRVGIRSDGKFDIFLHDRLTKTSGKARALAVVNAAGPWADRVLSILLPRHRPILTLSKGIHLVLKQKISNEAIALSSSDKRIIFIIPWRGSSLVGTTDTLYRDSLEEVHATREEVDFLLAETKKITGKNLFQRSDIVTTFAGLRPLACVGGRKTSKISRSHMIHEMPRRFLSIAGGKYTTHRRIAEEVCDRLEQTLKRKGDMCKTADLPLFGSFDLPSDEPPFKLRADLTGLSRPLLELLIQMYGRRMREVIGIANRNHELQKPICREHPLIGAQVIFAIEQENARTLTDVCVRRLRLDQTFCRGLDCVYKIAEFMTERLQWSMARKESEVADYLSWVRKNTASFV